MRFSILTMLGIITAASVSSALSQLQFETGCMTIIAIVAVSFFVVPKTAWRYCIYGGICGIVIGIILMTIYTRMTLGYIVGRSHLEMGPVFDIIHTWRPWIIFCGSLIGGTLGLFLFHHRKQNKSRKVSA